MVLASNIATVLFNMFYFVLIIIFILYIDTFLGLGPGPGHMIWDNRPEYGPNNEKIKQFINEKAEKYWHMKWSS